LGPDDFDLGFFFNTNNFLNNRKVPGRVIRFEMRGEDEKAVAAMCVTLIEKKAYSPWRAPFGSVEYLEFLQLRILEKFIYSILKDLKSRGIASVEVVHYPDIYHPENCSGIDEIFENNGFLKTNELNQHIPIDENRFKTKIFESERNRINKCERAGFVANLEGIDSLQEAYDLLAQSRFRKNYPASMSLNDLSEMFRIHPERYRLFTVRDQDTLVAITISIIVSNNILYNFYHSDHSDYLSRPIG